MARESCGKRGCVRGIAVIVLAVLSIEFAMSLYQRLFNDDEEPQIRASALPKLGDFQVEEAFPGNRFQSPINIENAGDDRLFVVEQAGRIKVLSVSKPSEKAKPFADISAKVKTGGEQGLLGLAFHPQFSKNGEVFLHYSSLPKGNTAISRFRVKKDDPTVLDPESEEIILTQEQPFANHNGGPIFFGNDGFLYIGLGDGGSGNDPYGNGQNLKTILGKLLRIDVDHPANGKPYGIPADNPFIGKEGEGVRPEIFAYGLRNPWRVSIDRPTGHIWAADVGQNKWEEIDLIEKGKNYGWNILEATHCLENDSCTKDGLTMPVFEYGREEGKCVTGGFVYRGTRLPLLTGSYVFGDFVSGRIWAISQVQGSSTVSFLAESKLLLSTFGLDHSGELYMASYADGKVYRFKDPKK